MVCYFAILAIYSGQQLVVRDGGDRGLLGSGALGIVFKTPKQSVFCILFLGGPLSPSEGVSHHPSVIHCTL